MLLETTTSDTARSQRPSSASAQAVAKTALLEEVTYELDGSGLMKRLMKPCETSNGEQTNAPESRSLTQAFFAYRETILGFVILLNCFTMGLELDFPWAGWKLLNQSMLVLYIIDLWARMYEEGLRSFIWRPWNWIDTVVVIASALELWVLPLLSELQNAHSMVSAAMLFLRLCRLLRAVRVFTVVRAMRPLFNLLSGLSEALSSILWLLVLVFIFLYAFGLVFTELFGHGLAVSELSDAAQAKAADTFRTVPLSVFALFRAMSADMTDLGPLLSASSGVVLPLCWGTFQMSASWLLLSTLTATVVNTMCIAAARREKEERSKIALEAPEVIAEQLEEVFSCIETNHFGEIGIEELNTFLSVPANQKALERIASVDLHKAITTWYAMQEEGTVDLHKYTEKLAASLSTDLESSVVRLETQVRHLQHSVDQIQLYVPVLRQIAETQLQVPACVCPCKLDADIGNHGKREVAVPRGSTRRRSAVPPTLFPMNTNGLGNDKPEVAPATPSDSDEPTIELSACGQPAAVLPSSSADKATPDQPRPVTKPSAGRRRTAIAPTLLPIQVGQDHQGTAPESAPVPDCEEQERLGCGVPGVVVKRRGAVVWPALFPTPADQDPPHDEEPDSVPAAGRDQAPTLLGSRRHAANVSPLEGLIKPVAELSHPSSFHPNVGSENSIARSDFRELRDAIVHALRQDIRAVLHDCRNDDSGFVGSTFDVSRLTSPALGINTAG